MKFLPKTWKSIRLTQKHICLWFARFNFVFAFEIYFNLFSWFSSDEKYQYLKECWWLLHILYDIRLGKINSLPNHWKSPLIFLCYATLQGDFAIQYISKISNNGPLLATNFASDLRIFFVNHQSGNYWHLHCALSWK